LDINGVTVILWGISLGNVQDVEWRMEMDNSNIFKVWGKRRRIHLNGRYEIDLLDLKKDTYCSTHRHTKKINKFVVVSGKVKIQSEFGDIILKANDVWEVRPPMVHRFMALEDSVMVEIAYVEDGTIDPKDIDRLIQGGKIIEGTELSHDELREKGMLEL
jgi:quercetin dioxygenase-like cupin family protein